MASGGNGETITVNVDEIKSQAAQMRGIADNFAGYNYTLNFSEGSGAFVDEMKNMANKIKDIGMALSQLANATANRLDAAAAQFTASDERAGKQFGK